jgi:uncharacterized C2H2 Zn-finger protein
MGAKSNQAKKGSSRKVGRNLVKCAAYRAAYKHEKSHIKRIMQSCGYKFARQWATAHNCLFMVDRYAASQPKVQQ